MWIWNKLFSLINNFVDDPELQNMCLCSQYVKLESEENWSHNTNSDLEMKEVTSETHSLGILKQYTKHRLTRNYKQCTDESTWFVNSESLTCKKRKLKTPTTL